MNRSPLALAIPAGLALLLGLTLMNRAQPQSTPHVVGGGGALSQIDSETVVTVYLRGDMSGLAFHDRSTSGFLETRGGKIAAIDDKWLVLDSGRKKSIIPLDAIAVVDTVPSSK